MERGPEKVEISAAPGLGVARWLKTVSHPTLKALKVTDSSKEGCDLFASEDSS